MSGTATLILAFVLSTIGWVLTSSTVATDYWKLSSSSDDGTLVTTATFWSHLWNMCVSDSTGDWDCRDLTSMPGLDGYVQACRGLMVGAVCLGFFGSVFALVGMKCTTIGGTVKSKARLALFAGVNFILSGLCSLTACSLYAHQITAEFFDPMLVSQKYELGAALFIGWGGSLLCLVGGGTLFFSSVGSCTDRRPQTRYLYKGAASQSHVTSSTRGTLRPAGQRPPLTEYSTSSCTKQFDKNAYV